MFSNALVRLICWFILSKWINCATKWTKCHNERTWLHFISAKFLSAHPSKTMIRNFKWQNNPNFLFNKNRYSGNYRKYLWLNHRKTVTRIFYFYSVRNRIRNGLSVRKDQNNQLLNSLANFFSLWANNKRIKVQLFVFTCLVKWFARWENTSCKPFLLSLSLSLCVYHSSVLTLWLGEFKPVVSNPKFSQV